MKEEKKWGIFCKGTLMAEYPNNSKGYEEVLEDVLFAYQETGVPHEIKQFSTNTYTPYEK